MSRARGDKGPLYRRAFAAMGSPCEVQLFAPRAQAIEVADSIVADVERLEARIKALESENAEYRAENARLNLWAQAECPEAVKR